MISMPFGKRNPPRGGVTVEHDLISYNGNLINNRNYNIDKERMLERDVCVHAKRSVERIRR